MASPTEVEIQTQLQNATHLLQEAFEFGSLNAENWNDLQDTYIQSLETDFPAAAAGSIIAGRSGLNSLLSGSAAILTPVIQAYGKFIQSSAKLSNIDALLDDLTDHFIDNAQRITSRQFTFASPSAIVGTGDGTINRLTVDENNLDLEAGFPELKTATCLKDQNTGAQKNREEFLFTGSDPGEDLLVYTGSGLEGRFSAKSKRDSILGNSSFDTTDITGGTIRFWTSSVTINGTNYSVQTDVFHEARNSNDLARSLRIINSAILSQKLSVRNRSLTTTEPFYMQLAFNAQNGTATGTLQIELGNKTVSVVVDGLTGYQVLRLPLDQNLWYNNFRENDLDVKIDWTSTGGAGLDIDDLILVPMQAFDGTWYTIVGGEIPFLTEDESTWTDTVIEAIIQFWLIRAFQRTLPHATGGSITITDP